MSLYPCVRVCLLSGALSFGCAVSAHAGSGDGVADIQPILGLDGKLRTVFYDVDNRETDQRSGAWTTAFWLNGEITSGSELLALGGSFYGVARLEMAQDGGCSRPRCSYQLLNDANEGFAKLGQAYVRFQAPSSFADALFDDGSASMTIGRQTLRTGLIAGSSSRSVPSSWRGYNLRMVAGNLELGLAQVDRVSLRNQAGFHRLSNFDKKTIDYIIGGEIFYQLPVLANSELLLKYRNGFARDFLQAHNLDAMLTTPLERGGNATIGVRYYHTEKDGDLWLGTGWGGSPLFDNNASVINLHGLLQTPSGWFFDAAISHYRAHYSPKPKAGATGYIPPGAYYYDLGANTHGFWNITTNGFAEDMMYDGETVMMAGVGYGFSSPRLKGLSAGYSFHYGSGMHVTALPDQRQTRVSEHEHDLFMIWRFQDPLLRGLTFKLKLGLYRNDPLLRQAIRKEENDLRVWLDYDFVAF